MHGYLTLVFWIVAASGLVATARMLLDLRSANRLPACDSFGVVPAGSKVSVVLAARDEELRIGTCVRRLLGQQGVRLEIIVVDDRSTDRTGEILRRLAAEDARLKVLRVDTLPEGWLGKCHACHVGAASATGEWILFTDADVWLKPDVIARAVLAADRERADHICLTPGVAPGTAGMQAWHLAFLLGLAGWLRGVNHDQPGRYLGMGAFNLVRAPAYRAIGGYEALRLTVVDDVKLGLLLVRAGKRTRGFIGGDDAECHWASNVAGMIKIMEKNYFAIVDYRLALILGAVLFIGLFCLAGLLGPLTGSLAGFAASAGLLSMIIPAAMIAAKLRWSPGPALLVPFMFPVMAFAMLNSAVVTLRQGGVRWRDTFYSLETLRKGNVRQRRGQQTNKTRCKG